jgi:hypothetical protein
MRFYSTSIGGALLLATYTTAAQPALTAPEPPAIVSPGTGLQALPAPGWQALPVEVPSPYRNNAMRIAGIVLTSLASAMVLAGSIVTGLDLHHGNGLATMAAGVPLFVTSTVPASIGIPLWVVGASPPKAAPSVGLGSLRLTF